MGNPGFRFTEVYATNGVINTSDKREKKDITETDLGLDFINSLQPVSYRWNTGVDQDLHFDLVAQEAEEAISRFEKSGKTSIVTHDETTDRYGVRYSELISPMIKAIQEIYSKVAGLNRDIASVKEEKVKIDEKIQTIEIDNTSKDLKIQRLELENKEIKSYLCTKDPTAAMCK